MWRHIGQSLQGSSHLADETPCQDNHSVRVLGENSARTLVACCADGAGSAKHSELGSSIVCKAMIENAAKYFEANGGFEKLERESILERLFVWGGVLAAIG